MSRNKSYLKGFFNARTFIYFVSLSLPRENIINNFAFSQQQSCEPKALKALFDHPTRLY
jgi:hypothetical protein